MAGEQDFLAEYDDEGTPPAPSDAKPTEKETETSKNTNDNTEEEVTASLDTNSSNKEEEATKESNQPTDGNELIEQQAREQGWVPFEEWKGDPKDWRPPEVFIERGEYFRTMKNQKKKIDNLEDQLQELVNMQSKIREDERKNTISELKKQKKDAMEDQDFDAVAEIDEKLDQAKEEELSEKYRKDTTQNNSDQQNNQLSSDQQEILDDWMSKNIWYDNDENKREYADTIGLGYRSRNPNASLQEVLDYVGKEVAARFGTSTPQQNRSSSPVADSQTTTAPKSSKNKKKSYNDLSDQQKNIAKRFVDAGAIQSVDEYIAELENIGEL